MTNYCFKILCLISHEWSIRKQKLKLELYLHLWFCAVLNKTVTTAIDHHSLKTKFIIFCVVLNCYISDLNHFQLGRQKSMFFVSCPYEQISGFVSRLCVGPKDPTSLVDNLVLVNYVSGRVGKCKNKKRHIWLLIMLTSTLSKSLLNCYRKTNLLQFGFAHVNFKLFLHLTNRADG